MANPISGQIAIASAGTAQQGPSVDGDTFVYQGHPDNSGNVLVGNDGSGDVSTSTGLALAAGDAVALRFPPDKLRFDAEENDDVVCWHVY